MRSRCEVYLLGWRKLPDAAMSKRAISLLLAAVAGCATTPKYEAMLERWVGMPEDTLVRAWGPPDRVYDGRSVRTLTYHRGSPPVAPGAAQVYYASPVGMRTASAAGTPPMALNSACITTFEVAGGVVRSWRWQGNDCKAK